MLIVVLVACRLSGMSSQRDDVEVAWPSSNWDSSQWNDPHPSGLRPKRVCLGGMSLILVAFVQREFVSVGCPLSGVVLVAVFPLEFVSVEWNPVQRHQTLTRPPEYSALLVFSYISFSAVCVLSCPISPHPSRSGLCLDLSVLTPSTPQWAVS